MQNVHATIARGIIATASLWTAVLQTFSTTSLAYKAAGESLVIDAVNVIVFFLALFAAADVVWSGILRRGYIWPSFPAKARNHICVATYTALSAAFGVRAFIASGEIFAALHIGLYYVMLAAFIAAEAYAIANENRKP
jgi:hypothetical protein